MQALGWLTGFGLDSNRRFLKYYDIRLWSLGRMLVYFLNTSATDDANTRPAP